MLQSGRTQQRSILTAKPAVHKVRHLFIFEKFDRMRKNFTISQEGNIENISPELPAPVQSKFGYSPVTTHF
jgi:hypothetical protein